MIRQYIITLRENTKFTFIDEQSFIDALRRMTPYIQEVSPIIEMGTPMSLEVLAIHKLNAAALVDGGDAVVRKWGLQMQELLTEIDRARLAELVTSKALQVSAHEKKELEHKVSVLEQRLAQFGPVEERR